MADVKAVINIAKALEVPVGTVYLNEEKIVTRTNDKTKETLTGFANILTALAHESPSDVAKNSIRTREIEAQVYQWIEYAVLYVAPGANDKHIAQQLLRDFNKLFISKSYLVGYTLTVADVAVYHAIYDLVKSLSPLEKENYINLSRWFNHLQQRTDIRQDADLLNFSSIYLPNRQT